MQSPTRVLGRIFLGIYNILSTYLLGWVLFWGFLALGFHLLTELAIEPLGFKHTEQWWAYVEWRTGVDALFWRFVIYVTLQAAVLYFGRSLWRRGQARIEGFFDIILRGFRSLTEGRPRLYLATRGIFTIGVTLVLVPFVFQPTLVGGGLSTMDWVHRTANLADGTASRNIVDSVMGGYRRLIVDDVASHGGVDDEDITMDGDEDDHGEPGMPREVIPEDEVVADEPPGAVAPPVPSGREPLMDRWDPQIRAVTGDNREMFAFVKAFMRIESSGRQFAVSPTGCAGLMQFCAGTAREQPFRGVFGRGSVYTCGCHPNCRTPQSVIKGLETGNRDVIADLEDQFPCDLTDARFDGVKSIRAGAKYIERLANSYDNNLYLMYIGYNSGPGVANTVWRKIGGDANAGLERISRHLANALRPHFHGASNQRANSLVQTHLPRLRRAYETYYEASELANQSIDEVHHEFAVSLVDSHCELSAWSGDVPGR